MFQGGLTGIKFFHEIMFVSTRKASLLPVNKLVDAPIFYDNVGREIERMRTL